MFWASSNRRDTPKLHALDISFIVTVLISSIKTPLKLTSTMGTQSSAPGPIAGSGKQYLAVMESGPSSSGSSHKSIRQLKELLQITSLLGMNYSKFSFIDFPDLYFLGLKILIIGFSKQLKREWSRITQAIKSICNKQTNISSNLLSFIDFIVTYKTPIFIILRPFLLNYV